MLSATVVVEWVVPTCSVSELGDVVITCFPCYVEVPVLGFILVLDSCLVQLLGICKPEPASGDGAPDKVPGDAGVKCL